MEKKFVENERSERLGLWYSKEWDKCYSQVLDVKDLIKYKGPIRIVMTRNKFKEGKEDRPSYVFWITGTNDIEPKQQILLENKEDTNLAFRDEDGHFRKIDGTRLFELEEVQHVLNQNVNDVQAGYVDNLVKDYIDIR